MPDYTLCGWRVRSALDLPELVPWTGDARPPDLEIRLGRAEPPEGMRELAPWLRLGGDGALHLRILGVARIGLAQGRDVVVEPFAGADPADVRIVLLGSVFGMVCHSRGLFPLHAASIRLGGGAVAFAGESGAGKSTLAAALAQRGHVVLSDDVCVIDPGAPGGPVVLPSFARIKLWPDSLAAVGLPAQDMLATVLGRGKTHYRLAPVAGATQQALPLRAVHVLRAGPAGVPPDRRRLRGAGALGAVHDQVYRRGWAQTWGHGPRLFRQAAQIAGAVPVFNLSRALDLDQLDPTLDLIEDELANA